MRVSRIILSALSVGAIAALTAWETGSTAHAQRAAAGNYISGEGFPTTHPVVTKNWGELPAGRKWGTSAGIDIDPKDGNIWAYERCGAGTAGGGPVDCETNPVDPVLKFDRRTGKLLAAIGKNVMITPHGIHVDRDGNVWVADFAGNKAGTKGHQVHKFSPDGKLLMSLGQAGKPGNADGQFNQPNDVVTGPDGSIYVSDGHNGQGMTTVKAVQEGIARGDTARVSKFTRDGKFVKEWGKFGSGPSEFRTPHALAMDSSGRLFVADRGNHRIQIFDQEGKFLQEFKQFSRISGLFITPNDMLYAIDSESSPERHPNWKTGVRIGSTKEDKVLQFIPPHETGQPHGAAGEGVAVDRDGNVYGAEGPISRKAAGGGLTKYAK